MQLRRPRFGVPNNEVVLNMTPTSVIVTIAAYFAVMFIVSWFSGKKTDNAGFFSGNRKSPWYIVAIAMIGSAMSGVTFVSVPGMVASSGFGYMQMVLGFFVGQLVIAYVLIPLFYKLNLVSIYQYLQDRLGNGSYRTGAWFFFISKLLGASVRLYVVCLILQMLVFDPLGIPQWVNVIVSMIIVMLYTVRGGVKSVIWTDVLKTICMVTSIILCIVFISKNLSLDYKGIVSTVSGSGMSRIFYFDDVNHPQYFFKQFLAGIFTLIATTGLDQDMMQRSLSCKNPADARKNIITSALMQTVVIFLFLCLGVLLYTYAASAGIDAKGDGIFPAVAAGAGLPPIVGIMFILGLVSCAYAAGGSALTSLTTSFTVDILGVAGKDEATVAKTRKNVHLCMAAAMTIVIIVFGIINNTSAIDAVYKLASYTYGPILGMFAFGILTKRKVKDRFIPVVAVAAPIICFILQSNSQKWFGGYQISYELLIMNALFTAIGMFALSYKEK